VLSFTLKGVNHYDLAVLLEKRNIAVRVGNHCAMPLMNELGVDGTIRVSLAPYNNNADIQAFGSALVECIGILTEPTTKTATADTLLDEKEVLLSPIAESIKQAKSWDQTYRQLMLAGKGLIRLQDEYKSDTTAVFGCESQVWIKCDIDEDKVVLEGDSPSKIVRGLLALVLLFYHRPKGGGFEASTLSMKLLTKLLAGPSSLVGTCPVLGKKCNS
jgi:cysteine desulfurase/selenocysteine lyase